MGVVDVSNDLFCEKAGGGGKRKMLPLLKHSTTLLQPLRLKAAALQVKHLLLVKLKSSHSKLKVFKPG